MTKPPCSLPFATKATQPLGIVAYLRRQDFYRYAIAQQDVSRKVNCAHSALTKQRFDFVLAIKHRAHDRRRIIFEHLTVSWAKAHTIVVLLITNCAVFHAGFTTKR